MYYTYCLKAQIHSLLFKYIQKREKYFVKLLESTVVVYQKYFLFIQLHHSCYYSPVWSFEHSNTKGLSFYTFN